MCVCVYIGCVLFSCADCMLVYVSGFYLVSVGLVVFVQLYSGGEPSHLMGAPVFLFFAELRVPPQYTLA